MFSTGGGAILDKAVEHFSGITVFAPVMNGAGGNLVAIQVRLFTYDPLIAQPLSLGSDFNYTTLILSI